MPRDGVFHCTTIYISNGVTLKFNRNALNTPVYFLAQGDITVNGTIDVSGQASGLASIGEGGPGGFDGGMSGFVGESGGVGYGPGGGLPGNCTSAPGKAGAGSYRTRGSYSNDGAIYGSELLIPLAGGSGGGGINGSPGIGGGGGGGRHFVSFQHKN
ncbi:MAG: hypothetical protein GKR87_09550 [Kiritimatiellae bacterium]|nr:hypothetical protein [Kiritimatiellia bacterium]